MNNFGNSLLGAKDTRPVFDFRVFKPPTIFPKEKAVKLDYSLLDPTQRGDASGETTDYPKNPLKGEGRGNPEGFDGGVVSHCSFSISQAEFLLMFFRYFENTSNFRRFNAISYNVSSLVTGRWCI